MALFDQAIEAYKQALEVYTKADLPQSWAGTESNLGIALTDEGERAAGDKATILWRQAVDAFEKALEVETKADLPQDWARTMRNLARAHKDLGDAAAADAEQKAADEVSSQ